MNTVQINFYNPEIRTEDYHIVEQAATAFLNFSNKEEYLNLVAAWREQYAEVSSAIRAVKNHNRTIRRSRDVITRRMRGAYISQDYYANRWQNMARHNLTVNVADWDLSVRRIHPTHLLEIRAKMKLQAGRQMEENYTEIEIEDIGLVLQRMAAVAATL